MIFKKIINQKSVENNHKLINFNIFNKLKAKIFILGVDIKKILR